MTGPWTLLSLLFCAGAGFLIGLAYFAGLWWTAQRASAKGASAGAFLAGSFIVRMALLVVALFLLTRGQPGPVAAALVGIWLARRASVGYIRREIASPPGEAAHEEAKNGP